jgi:tRNA(Ile)-lysidine synthase
MSLKNLNVSKKTHKFLLDRLKDRRTLQIYKKFENNLPIKKNFLVAISGGPDSLALSFFAKIYSIKKSIDIKYFIVDHKLRKNSTLEARFVQKKLKNLFIKSNILTWKGTKPKKNIQSIAREKRYKLLTDAAKKHGIKNILLGHQLDDLFENFFIRILRGSGLKGLISLDRETHKNQINLIRPLIKIDKKDLIYVSNYIFGTYINDPSNEDDKFKRVKIRNFLKQLISEGFDRKKFFLTIKNLKVANENIEFYTKKNLEDNVTILSKKNNLILKENFFSQSNEVVFRSLTEVIKIVGKKYYAVRGKKIDKVVNLINTKSSFKVTLGGCIIKKVNQTLILSKE